MALFSVRTALLAMVGFLPTPGKGAIGSLDYPTAERASLAKKYVLIGLCLILEALSMHSCLAGSWAHVPGVTLPLHRCSW